MDAIKASEEEEEEEEGIALFLKEKQQWVNRNGALAHKSYSFGEGKKKKSEGMK